MLEPESGRSAVARDTCLAGPAAVIPGARRSLRVGLLTLLAAGANVASASDGVTILLYHRFGEPRYPSTNTSVADFERQLEVLERGGHAVIELARVVRAFEGKDTLPPRAVAITVDDAYRSAYAEAWPRLRSRGFPLTIFVSTEVVDGAGADAMTWQQLREAVASGVAIGNHTHGHEHLPTLPTARVLGTVRAAQARLQAELGAPSRLFAHPYGEASSRVTGLIEREGFAAAFGQHSGVAHAAVGRYYLPRFSFNEQYGDIARFRIAVNALPLPVSGLTPANPTVAENPPRFGFTVAADVGRLDRLACYASGTNSPLALERTAPRRFEARPPRAFTGTRARFNCTLPVRTGQWRWLGMQYYLGLDAAEP